MKVTLFILAIFFVCATVQAQDKTEVPSYFKDVEIALNDGDKWIVTEDMRIVLSKSFDYINNAEITSVGKGKKLAKKLLKGADRLIEHCEMDGAGHHEFHIWLAIYYDIVEEMSYNPYLDDHLFFYGELQKAKQIYTTHFE